jgi:hypothetical protein
MTTTLKRLLFVAVFAFPFPIAAMIVAMSY